MERKARIKLGLIGNMGPKADELFQRQIRLAMGASDHGGIYMVVEKSPNIPDRTEAILNGGASPVEEITYCAESLLKGGCQFAIIACNTAHYFLEQVQKGTKLVILNMIEATSEYVTQNFGDKKVALVATNGTVETGIYHKYLPNIITPHPEVQKNLVHQAVLHIKAREYQAAEEKFVEAVRGLVDSGVQVVVLGCTELPLAQARLEKEFPETTFVNPAAVIAKLAIGIYREAEKCLNGDKKSADPIVNDIVEMARAQVHVR